MNAPIVTVQIFSKILPTLYHGKPENRHYSFWKNGKFTLDVQNTW